MVIGFRGIPKITFPVFLLDSGNWEEYDGLLFLDNMILDDKNQQGKTLGARRVQTPHREFTSTKTYDYKPKRATETENKVFYR